MTTVERPNRNRSQAVIDQVNALKKQLRAVELEQQVKMLEDAAVRAAEEAYMIFRDQGLAMQAAKHSAPALQRLSALIRSKGSSSGGSRSNPYRRNPNRELDLPVEDRGLAQGHMMLVEWMAR